MLKNKILTGLTVLVIATGCSNQSKNEEMPLTLSNGLNAYCVVTTSKDNGTEVRNVYIKNYDIIVHDYGGGNVVAIDLKDGRQYAPLICKIPALGT